MYRKLIWCYVFVLTLLDLSLNSKLTAQGKSHGVTVHDSLAEGITFQEWGSESVGSGAGSGRALPAAALRAEPPALALGRAALGAAHAATVTLTNTANTTMHLASIAGTTPDFHASFFDSKTLACGANTSFSVVFLGRREGPVSQHLYIHTSLGVLKYPVSAVGVASEWALWPLVGVRVPHNATLRPLLTMHNPTDHTVQVVEMYSSAGWLGLQLPDGGCAAPRAQWQLPPRSSRALVRLRLRAPAHKPGKHADTRAAYIRIKANVTGPPLVVVVEAAAAAAGAHAEPLQLRAGTRGAQDAPYTFSISLGNSDAAATPLGAGAWGACRGAPHAPPAPHDPPADGAPRANGATHTTNGAGTEGVQVSPLRAQLEPHSEPVAAAHATFDFAKLWAGAEAEAGADAEADAGAGEERWCAGWAGLAGSVLPYSVRLVPGTLRMSKELHFVTADEEGCAAAQEVRARNEFGRPVRLVAVHFPPELLQHFEVESFAPLSLGPGAEAAAARLRLRRRDAAAVLDSRVTVLTNLTHTSYSVPVKLYSGTLHIEWQWPEATASELPLGAVATSSTRRVLARVRNPAPAPLCVTAHAALPGATFSLSEGGCVPAGGSVGGVLTVVAPARAGAVRGAVWLQAPAARVSTTVTLRALAGAVRARLVHERAQHQPDLEEFAAAPWASGWAPALVVESSMALRMRLTRVEPVPPDPALVFIPPEDPEAWWIGSGTSTLGHVAYLPERACGASCYTGLAVAEPGAWLRAPLPGELALLARRRALYHAELVRCVRNVSLALDTSEMVRIPVSGWVRVGWPRLVAGGGGAGAGWAGLAGVGGGEAHWLRVRNPAPHALLLHARVDDEHPLPPGVLMEVSACATEECAYTAGVFGVAEWRAVRGAVTVLEGGAGGDGGEGAGGVALLLAPRAELELRVDFAPPAPRLYTAVLYLRNNLTIVEAVQLGGRGAVPSFELAGRRAHAHRPILLQMTECEEGQECGAEAGEDEEGGRWVVRRTIIARNTGAVPLRLRGWRLAGEPCRARGFRLSPCAPLALAPNESRALTLAFRADCSLARVACPLTLRAAAGAAAFRLLAAVPARLLPACAAALPRPPWEPPLRAAAALLAVLALALALAAAALDAERLLRRARDARAAPPGQAPLDLRALAREAPPAPAPAPVAARARRRPARRSRPAPDPAVERRAFELWRAEVLRRDAPHASDSSSRSSEEAAPAAARAEPAPPPDASDTEPDTEEQPRTSGDEDANSTGTDSSSPPDDAEEPAGPAAGASPAAPPAPAPRAGSPPPAEGARAAPARPRREASSPSRRTEPPTRPRAAPGKHHTRKDKISKRRGERAGATAARVSPPHAEPRAAPAAGASGAGAGAGAPGAPVRWGASWSSVVAAGALAPIGSDVRRPAPPAAATPPAPPAPRPDHSLFYFNDAHALRAPGPGPGPAPAPRAPDAEFAWRQERSPFDAPVRDYRVPDDTHTGNNAYGTIGSPWSGVGVGGGGAAPGLWAGGVRPPPGFGPRAAAPPVRAFDPFHSLASIWAPAAFDWRADPRDREPPH